MLPTKLSVNTGSTANRGIMIIVGVIVVMEIKDSVVYSVYQYIIIGHIEPSIIRRPWYEWLEHYMATADCDGWCTCEPSTHIEHFSIVKKAFIEIKGVRFKLNINICNA